MLALVTLRDVEIGFGGHPVLEHVSLQINAGERVCLVGRNGTGKSTLLKLIGGVLGPDAGEMAFAQGICVAYLSQEVPRELNGSVFEVVAAALGDIGGLIQEYHHASHQVAVGEAGAGFADLERIQDQLESCGGWNLNQRVESVLSRLQLDPEADFTSLSGGLKRRVLLARALATQPDVLLLDEPTNHLDIEAIEWLEEFLIAYKGTVLFVTHDRMLVRKLATRILDLDRGRLTSWPGDYQTYRRRKQESLDAEARQQAKFDKLLSQEEVWIREGIKARRSRDEGRVRRLLEMRAARRARRSAPGRARIRVQDAEITGKKVIEAEGLGFSYGGRAVISDFSALILRGDRVGILGPNGCGKTTLLRLLLGQLEAEQGSVHLGTGLRIAYFDQHRMMLDPERTVQDSVNDGKEQVLLDDRPQHVIGYLQNFLFTPSRARTPVKALSGGERNRLLLARLFAEPSNVLVLDEPTNDLDVETLELLEEQVMNYPGTVLLVSHDRDLINHVVTSTLAFEGTGRFGEYVGGYDDWLRQKPVRAADAAPARAGTRKRKSRDPAARPAKLGYKEQRELAALPDRIAALESEQHTLHARLCDADFYRQDSGEIPRAKERLAEIERELSRAYARWEDLEALGVK